MRLRPLTLILAFALSFHAEIAWAGGSDCVEMGTAAESSHVHGSHSDHGPGQDQQDRAPECPTPTHHIAACSAMGVAAVVAVAADNPLSGHLEVFRVVRLLDRLPTSLPSPPPWV